MSWDPVWEQVFSSRPWGRYPPEELVRFVARTFPTGGAVRARILELGCGPGANVWYLAREGFDVYGIDGSETAIALARERLHREGLAASLAVGDFSDLSGYEDDSFDGVIDVASVQCNPSRVVDSTFVQAARVLRPGGTIFSMLVARRSWGDGLGRELEPGTFADILDGPLAGTGVCRFFELSDVLHHFRHFQDVTVEYSTRSLEDRTRTYTHWVAAGKRGA